MNTKGYGNIPSARSFSANICRVTCWRYDYSGWFSSMGADFVNCLCVITKISNLLWRISAGFKRYNAMDKIVCLQHSVLIFKRNNYIWVKTRTV